MATDKEKLLELLQYCPDDFESILFTYLNFYRDDFSATRIRSLISRIDRDVLMCKVIDLERTVRISHERATYIKSFLDGSMFNDEEPAKKEYMPCQIENAQAILNACDEITY